MSQTNQSFSVQEILEVILATLRRIKKTGSPRISVEDRVAFQSFQTLCTCLSQSSAQDDIYGAIGLALLGTKYARKRTMFLQDFSTFLDCAKKWRMIMASQFIPIFEQMKNNITELENNPLRAEDLDYSNLPEELKSFRL